MLPFVANAAPRRLVHRFADFVPSRYVVVRGAMTTTFAYEMWNIFWLQFSAFASVLVLIAFARAARRAGRRADRALFSVAALALFAIQIVMFAIGSTLVRQWEDTEFKEMFIAVAFAVYSIETAARLRRHARKQDSFPQETFVPGVTRR
jgi:hypothetical protein